MGQAVVHFEIEGLDGPRLRSFYREMFDWKTEDTDYGLIAREETSNAESQGIGGAIAQVPEVPSTTWKGKTRAEGHSGGVTVFVEVPDVETALAQAESLGGKRMLGPDALFPGVEIGRFADPEGHLIGVITERRPAAS